MRTNDVVKLIRRLGGQRSTEELAYQMGVRVDTMRGMLYRLRDDDRIHGTLLGGNYERWFIPRIGDQGETVEERRKKRERRSIES